MTSTLKQDLHEIVTDTNITWGAFKNSVVLITGATGLVGGMLVRTLSLANEYHNLNMRIITSGRNQEKGEKIKHECNAKFFNGDIRNSDLFFGINGNIDYIFHCAAITKSADMVARPVDVMTTEIDGTRNILNLAQKKGCKSLVYLSSMEVYGQGLQGETDETKLGYIDLSNPRSCYPESKRCCEMLCVSYSKQFNLPVKIARLAQSFGAGTPKDDTRVFAQFARSAINGENIILHTEGKSRGNYCYISDSVCGLLTILLRGKNGEVYNVANPDASVTIREMAELVADGIFNEKIKVVVNIPNDVAKLGYAPTVGYRLNADKLVSLGWNPKLKLNEMYLRLLEDWHD